MKLSQRLKDEEAFVRAELPGTICERCGATLDTYADQCSADLDSVSWLYEGGCGQGGVQREDEGETMMRIYLWTLLAFVLVGGTLGYLWPEPSDKTAAVNACIERGGNCR